MNLSGKPGERSDLYATVDVELPRQLNPEERTHFEELAKIERKKHSAA
jgi:DnaJ-class molecular chaperone